MTEGADSPRSQPRPYRIGDVPEVFACITPTLTRFTAWERPGSVADRKATWRHDADRDEQPFVFVEWIGTGCLLPLARQVRHATSTEVSPSRASR